jgi:hypothetical protein
MATKESPGLRSHLADFETTTSGLLRPGQARAILNFAALFHEVIFLPDTALGDHEILIKSFHGEGHSGFFAHLRKLIEARILRVLMRDKVAVGDKILVASNPTMSEIFEGWICRDKTKWKGERGYTTEIDDKIRRAYCREVDSIITRPGCIYRYDPNLVKDEFRRTVREQLENGKSRLLRSIEPLPDEIKLAYRKALKDEWFTNAELWRVLRRGNNSEEAIILHGHINQQCYANAVSAGQSSHDIHGESLASFNLELQRRRPFAPEVQATLSPPRNLDELMERAAVVMPSPGVDMFEHLSVEQIVAIRRKASKVFEIAKREIGPSQMEDLRTQYLKALEDYWRIILHTFEKIFPEQMLQPTRLGLFVERELPTLDWLYRKFGKSLFTLLLRSKLGPASGVVGESANQVGILILQEKTPLNQSLRGVVPPSRWYRRGILGLDRFA